MFSTLKNFKSRLKNSSTWGEFFASYLINLDDIYKQLEGKTEKQQNEILKRALEDQTRKTKELIEEIAKHKEQIEELENSNKQKDLMIKELEQKQKEGLSLDGLKNKSKELFAVIEQAESVIKYQKLTYGRRN